jgi:hypothetical protein
LPVKLLPLHLTHQSSELIFGINLKCDCLTLHPPLSAKRSVAALSPGTH